MAKKRSRRRSHRTGSIITTRKLNGIGNLKTPGSFTGAVVPPILGGVVAGGTTLALENMSFGTAGLGRGMHLYGTSDWVAQWAPAIGLGATALVAVGMRFVAGMPQALATLASGAMVTGTLYAKKYLETSSTAGVRGVRGRGMGALVAEQMVQGLPARGTGAIVMEQFGQQGYNAYSGGEKVSLGAINANAFGTSAFEA